MRRHYRRRAAGTDDCAWHGVPYVPDGQALQCLIITMIVVGEGVPRRLQGGPLSWGEGEPLTNGGELP